MDEFFIGAGAILTAGPEASIADATLHAQPDAALAGKVEAALVDFEATQLGQLSRLLVVAGGWSGARFRAEVVRSLISQGECSFVDVVATLAQATGAREVHLFAHWQPDEATKQALAERGAHIEAWPLEAIGRAALVSGQRVERWRGGVQEAPRVRKHDAA
jgi:hypothetical protein